MHLVKKGDAVKVLSLALFFLLLVFASNVGFCQVVKNVKTTAEVPEYINVIQPPDQVILDLLPGVEKTASLEYTIQSSKKTSLKLRVTDLSYTIPVTMEISIVETLFTVELDGLVLLTRGTKDQVNALEMSPEFGEHVLIVTIIAKSSFSNPAADYTNDTELTANYYGMI
ncbi:MAG: hypothetical protein V1860_00125 [bacterium]